MAHTVETGKGDDEADALGEEPHGQAEHAREDCHGVEEVETADLVGDEASAEGRHISMCALCIAGRDTHLIRPKKLDPLISGSR